MTAADLDLAAIESYLSAALDETVVGTEVLHEALNVSIAVSTAETERAYVLRHPDMLRHTDLFNDPRAEYRVLERLEDTPIDAPEPVLFCEDTSVTGDRFLVTTYLDGESISVGARLPEQFRTADARERVALGYVETLAEIHTLPADRFEGVCDRQSAREQLERAVERLDEATSVTGREHPVLREVADWLRRNAPSNSERTLVHGDFKPGNVFFGGRERPEVTGVVDWETAFLGDPRTELGYVLLYWREDDDPTPSVDALEERYSADAVREARELAEDGFCPFTSDPGSPSRRELVARYEEASGINFDDERFYRAHAAFMLATVWADIDRHQVEAGSAPSRGALIDYVAMTARSIVDGEFPL